MDTMLDRIIEILGDCDGAPSAGIEILKAMKEPTPKMVEAGDAAMDSDCYFECNGTKTWHAMIDAALSE